MEKNHLKFYNCLSEKYPEEEIVYRTPSGIVRKKFVKELLKEYCETPFLDIGCGGGEYLKDFRENAFGLDIAFGSLIRCKQNAPEAMTIQSFAEKTRCIKAGSFKTILCSELIEHIEDTESLIKNISQMLMPDGILILTCPNYKNKRPLTETTEDISHFGIDDTEYLHTAYKPEELEKLTRKNGFTTLKIGTFEKELRYWRKITIKVSGIFPMIFGVMKGRKMAKNFELFTYYALKYIGILFLIKIIAPIGARSYVVAQKNAESAKNQDLTRSKKS